MASGSCAESATEYRGAEFVSAYATNIREKLWTYTTFYTFVNYVMNGKEDVFKDATVLDLACGDGIFSRWAASQGASRVVGIDMSEVQISLAHEIESSIPETDRHTIEYIVKDVLDIDGAEYGEFDVVLASHLLCYADTPEKLERMLEVASSCLKKGGRFVGVRECLDSSSKGHALMKCEGEIEGGPMFSYEIESYTDEGGNQQCLDYCKCKNDFRNSDGSTLTFTNYMVYESTMVKMFNDAGFNIISVGPQLSCSSKGYKLFPAEFIKTLTEDWGKILLYFDVTKL